MEEAIPNYFPDERKKRGRPRKNKETMNTQTLKGKKSGKPMNALTEDLLRAPLKMSSPDVEELCRKREEDAMRCGRTVKTIHNVGKRKNETPVLFSNSTDMRVGEKILKANGYVEGESSPTLPGE